MCLFLTPSDTPIFSKTSKIDEVMQVLEAVRRLEAGAPGAATGQVKSFMSEQHEVSAPECKKLLKRAVTEGFLLRKSNKFYFIPSNNMSLPALAVMRRRRQGGKRRSRRARYAVLAGRRGVSRSTKVRISNRRSIDLVRLTRRRTLGTKRRHRGHVNRRGQENVNKEQRATPSSKPQEQTNNTASSGNPEDKKNIHYIA